MHDGNMQIFQLHGPITQEVKAQVSTFSIFSIKSRKLYFLDILTHIQLEDNIVK